VEQYPSLMWFAVKALCLRELTDHPEFCFCLWEFDRSMDPTDPTIAITIAISLVLRFLSGCPDLELECREWSCVLILCLIWKQNYKKAFSFICRGERVDIHEPSIHVSRRALSSILLLIYIVSSSSPAPRTNR